MKTIKTIFITAVFSIFLVNTIWAFSVDSRTNQLNKSVVTASLNENYAPNFSATDMQGRTFELTDLRGKVVMLNFWATWCGWCMKDLPVMERLNKQYKQQGLVVLGINTEDRETAQYFLQKTRYTFRNVVDEDGAIGDLFGIEALPTVIIIGKDGRIVSEIVGAESERVYRQALREAGLK